MAKLLSFLFWLLLQNLLSLEDCKNLLTDDEGGKITEFSFPVMLLQNLPNLEEAKILLTDDGGKITELSFLDIQLQPLWQRFMEVPLSHAHTHALNIFFTFDF